jgi:hypothetical protein
MFGASCVYKVYRQCTSTFGTGLAEPSVPARQSIQQSTKTVPCFVRDQDTRLPSKFRFTGYVAAEKLWYTSPVNTRHMASTFTHMHCLRTPRHLRPLVRFFTTTSNYPAPAALLYSGCCTSVHGFALLNPHKHEQSVRHHHYS